MTQNKPSDTSAMNDATTTITAGFLADRHRLLSFIQGLLRDPQAAEDIFQEVWLKLAAAVEKGAVIENPPAWCRTVAKNLILMHWRSQKNSRVVVDSTLLEFVDFVECAYAENESVNETGPERQRALQDCLSTLPEKSRRLVELKYDKELSLKAIAATVQQSTDSVIKALLRLRQGLATCVEKKLKLQELGL